MTALRKIRSAFGGTAVILTYHRVTDDPIDPQGLAVSEALFEEHISAYARHYRFITARELFRTLAERRRIPERSIVITLDDGYADVATVVAPILERYGANATAFVCSGYVDGSREYWWDELEKLILLPGALPDEIWAEVNGRLFGGKIDDGRELSEAEASRFAAWRVTEPPLSARHSIYLAFARVLEPLAPADRESVLTQLREQLGIACFVRPSKRVLSAKEIATLCDGDTIEIGAHTSDHAWLAGLSLSQQRDEIFGGRDAISEWCGGRMPVSFAYPYGTAGALDKGTVELVAEAGFEGACTTQLGSGLPWGSVSRFTNPYLAPRTASGEIGADEMIALIDKRMGI